MLAFAISPAGDVLARGGSPIVVLRAGVVLFLFGPGFSILLVPFPLGADLRVFSLSLGAWMVLLAASFLSRRAVCSSPAFSVLS